MTTDHRRFGISPQLEKLIELEINSWVLNHSWKDLAQSICELSDIFIGGNAVTPWSVPRFRMAYLAYFLPLNLARSRAVIQELEKVKFNWGESILEFGSGPGTFHLAMIEAQGSKNLQWQFCEISSEAIQLHKNLVESRISADSLSWSSNFKPKSNQTVVASYALNEDPQSMAQLLSCQRLVLIEPSTQSAARRLMSFREQAMSEGFSAWAPCVHQKNCPLLTESKRDWCHDRIEFVPPSYFSKFSSYLPMRNDTLTFSYLAMVRGHAPELPSNAGRIIGDTLYEKGKVRQAFCRQDRREFLSWLTKEGQAPRLSHGSLFELPAEHEIKGSEIRLKGEGN